MTVGIETDYYIAVGQNTQGRKNFPERTFFWCQPNTWQFSLLNEPKFELAHIFNQIQTFFTGESERQIVSSTGSSDQVTLRPGSFKSEDIPAKGLTEQDRLSYVVNTIERQCQIVPVGSFKKNTLKEVKINEAFTGLKFNDMCNLSSYSHLRPLQQREKLDLAGREDDIFNHNFLDCVEASSKGSWSVQRDEINQAVVLIRSRLWPGYTSYARANTNIFGGVYIGDGVCNQDLPFMI